jgi:hypothetical protein
MYVIDFLADCRFGGLSLWWIVALNYLADCHLANCRLADCRQPINDLADCRLADCRTTNYNKRFLAS